MNKWQSSETWPPAGAQPMKFFLASAGKANTGKGDGALGTVLRRPTVRWFHVRPDEPAPSYGGNVCCTEMRCAGGAFDQRKMEDGPTSWYTSQPLAEGIEASGPIEATLYVSSDAKDTDIT